jgi:hypothetical protein
MRERKERQGSGEQKSRTWLVRIRQEIPSRPPAVGQSVASAANCLFSVSIGAPIMSSTPTRAGGLKHFLLHRRHAQQRHSSFPDIARGAENRGKAVETRDLVSPCHDIAPPPGEARLLTGSQPPLESPRMNHSHRRNMTASSSRPVEDVRPFDGAANASVFRIFQSDSLPVNSVTMLVLGRHLG